ncbi:putative glycerol-1-phosphate prenyltransferase [Lishizhenia tianjinensis]|uniref:Geranylgeranylglyceryl phosphate synthase n=1 Tax=Lishizhenia tianjinensis TaxID=477690 RepID=A0A1I7BWC2_9FLAO|nr:phosphoglycerol geranylgeranyltransferase [Lishizhenia tianjinensis]SFT91475.1 putative glycerol-1-phosphate prenyltransferase [Lishizhenia tianjinensis]
MTTKLLDQFKAKTGQIAVLIDPEKSQDVEYLRDLIKKAEFAGIDYFFVGGSTANKTQLDFVIRSLKALTLIPLVLFPGNYHQVSEDADALLYLSLLSGRNPEYLIGQHIQNASDIKAMNLEVIPTAYLLIDGGKQSAVAYVSQTTPLPQDQISLITNTAIAGELQGKQLIYLDAGSGATESVDPKIVKALQEKTTLPIVVGGGLRSIEQLENLKTVNILVVGNKLEEDLDFLLDIRNLKTRK